jgi:hypothetical protein
MPLAFEVENTFQERRAARMTSQIGRIFIGGWFAVHAAAGAVPISIPAEPAGLVGASVPNWYFDGARGGVFGSISSEPLGLRTASMWGYGSSHGRDLSHWLEPERSGWRLSTLGYAWRDVTLEGSVLEETDHALPRPSQQDAFKLAARSTRLSYHVMPALSLQFSRGTLGGLDQLVHNGDVRRTVLSATMTQFVQGAEWQTTFAWGRNTRKEHTATIGYLAETTFRFGGSHMGFGRFEQVGSDTLHLDHQLYRRAGKINKLSVGYFHDLHRRGETHLGVGAVASRHLLSKSNEAVHGSEPPSFMLFVRLKL